MSEATPYIEVGKVFADKYQVERVLGEGGMGLVVQARHLLLGHGVAIKILKAGIVSEDAKTRLLREAQAMIRVESSHVVRVFDVGEESGAPYVVMELLRGEDLAARLSSAGPLAIPSAVDFVIQALEAVGLAHKEGIVHRDLKPANLFVARGQDGTEEIKVLDFGISRMATSEEGDVSRLTTTSAMLGTPYYMPPEQIRDARDVRPTSDIWSMGLVLYELLSNDVPFPGRDMHSLLAQIIEDAPRPLGKFGVDVPPELEAVIMRCLEKDPRRRFASASELALALEPYGTPRSLRSRQRLASLGTSVADTVAAGVSIPPSFSKERAAETAPAASFPTVNVPMRSRGAATPLTVFGILLFGVTGAYFFFRGSGPTAQDGSQGEGFPKPAALALTAPVASVPAEVVTAPQSSADGKSLSEPKRTESAAPPVASAKPAANTLKSMSGSSNSVISGARKNSSSSKSGFSSPQQPPLAIDPLGSRD